MANVSKAHGCHLLARYYDTFFTSHRRYWGAARQALLGKAITTAASACDLACGTGSTAVALARQDIRMFAVDLSPTMCRLARLKAQKAKASVHVLRADMRDFHSPEKVDIIFCEYDALNHVPDKSDLGLVAQSVSSALVPGGFFYFDVNDRKIFQKRWLRPTYVEHRKGLLITHGGYDAETDKGWIIDDFFVRDGH